MPTPGARRPKNDSPAGLALPLAALGVVYGDIGTSPLYAIRECFFGTYSLAPSAPNVLGVLSLVTWSLLLVISLKYLTFILRVDHDGEGGILALMELVKRSAQGRRRKLVLGLGLFGAALLYGDGMITPAISVLSAMEGLEVAADDLFRPYIIPMTVAILAALFLLQRLGTAGVGRLFGPVMLAWFFVLALAGGMAIAARPGVLAAANPLHALTFFADNGFMALAILGIVFLVVTGGEALYADLGHFGRGPIVLSWYVVVLPALLLNYYGQGALVLERGAELTSPFYELFPGWALYPMVALATAATIIASQAIISGVFSLTFQAIQLGYVPRFKVRHTSSRLRGQIYVPAVNWLLLAATVSLVLSFRHSGNLAAAYGVAIAATMAITTALYAGIVKQQLAWPAPVLALGLALFFVLDLGFLGANLGKIPSGGWFPLVVAGIIAATMTTWHRGRRIEARVLSDRAEPIAEFLAREGGGRYRRVPGQSVYLTENIHGTPHLLMQNLRYNHALHRTVIVYTARVSKRPFVDRGNRLTVEHERDDIIRIIARYGFMERIDVPADLAVATREHQLELDLDRLIYFVGDRIPLTDEDVGMPLWQARLFRFLERNTRLSIETFNLPPARVIELGTQVPV